MCLSSTNFTMRYWPKYNTYVGSGFKVFHKLYTKDVKLNEWMEATSNWNERDKREMAELKKVGLTGGKYPLGFHILLSAQHASMYPSDYHRDRYQIYMVDFTDVLTFGRQVLYKTHRHADCVIARHMYIHKTPLVHDANLLFYLNGKMVK